MLNQFIENFKKSELYFNHKLQIGILIAGIIIGPIAESNEIISTIIIGIIIIGGPIFVMATYDGIIDDSEKKN